MQAYIAISYNKRPLLEPELNAMKHSLQQAAITPFVFVDNYSFLPAQEKEMMQHAFAAIDKSDLLIAEVSDKAIGIGVEVGYAKAKNKPVIYLRNATAEHSTTIAGTSDHIIIYEGIAGLRNQLTELLDQLKLNGS